MTETLLSPSNVLLFGRKVEDLQIVEPKDLPPLVRRMVHLASAAAVDFANPLPTELDNIKIPTRGKTIILLKNQPAGDPHKNGLYKIKDGVWTPVPLTKKVLIHVQLGKKNSGKYFTLSPSGTVAEQSNQDDRHGPFSADRIGLVSQLEEQLQSAQFPCFARIYGFSFEGFYYDLPRPMLFLVHGEGLPASELRINASGAPRIARAPGSPSLTGLGQADFQFSDDIMVWSYEKADYTIRMDVETGMFEQVLLDAMLDGPGGFDARGANARGANARGANARGANARGANARGANARGGGNSD